MIATTARMIVNVVPTMVPASVSGKEAEKFSGVLDVEATDVELAQPQEVYDGPIYVEPPTPNPLKSLLNHTAAVHMCGDVAVTLLMSVECPEFSPGRRLCTCPLILCREPV
jgi:hypothetical protein